MMMMMMMESNTVYRHICHKFWPGEQACAWSRSKGSNLSDLSDIAVASLQAVATTRRNARIIYAVWFCDFIYVWIVLDLNIFKSWFCFDMSSSKCICIPRWNVFDDSIPAIPSIPWVLNHEIWLFLQVAVPYLRWLRCLRQSHPLDRCVGWHNRPAETTWFKDKWCLTISFPHVLWLRNPTKSWGNLEAQKKECGKWFSQFHFVWLEPVGANFTGLQSNHFQPGWFLSSPPLTRPTKVLHPSC